MATATQAPSRDGLLHIGAVCRHLRDDFPDVSISKIRYLEDQGLLAPKRTQGGYRLFDEDDLERLRTILRLQRDEFLPLRVIRQELASPAQRERKRRRPTGLGEHEEEIDLGELCERAGVSGQLAKELDEYGLIEGRNEGGERLYSLGDADVAAACAKLAQFGVAPRHLRTFRTSANREAGLIEALVAPALRSRNPERRSAGLDDLQTLAELSQELSQLLFWRDLRQLASS